MVTKPYSDGWAPPVVETELLPGAEAESLIIEGEAVLEHMKQKELEHRSVNQWNFRR